MFVKMSLRDQLDCLVEFVGMVLLCLLPPCRTLALPTAMWLPSLHPIVFSEFAFTYSLQPT